MTVATTRPDSISTTTSTLITSSTGFDKIDLRLTDWTVQAGHRLNIHHRGNHEYPTLLFENSMGPVYGFGAHYQAGWWNVYITVSRPGIRHCLLGFNASKFQYSINYPAAHPHSVETAMSVLSIQLERIGVITDLTSAKVRRLEICTDVIVDRCLEDYWEVLAECPVHYSMRRSRWSHGVSWLNSRTSLKAYDKRSELLLTYSDVAKDTIFPPANTVRIESAVLTPAAIRNKIGVEYATDVEALYSASLNWQAIWFNSA